MNNYENIFIKFKINTFIKYIMIIRDLVYYIYWNDWIRQLKLN